MPMLSYLTRKPGGPAETDAIAESGEHGPQCIVCSALERSDNIVLEVEQRGDALWIVASNTEAQRVTSYSAGQLAGRAFAALLEPNADPAAFDALLAAAREGRAHRGQLRCRSQTGRPFWFGLHIMPAAKPAAGRFVVLGHDITEKLRQSAQETAVQGLLAKVFVTVDAPVYIIDLQGSIVMTNPAFDRLAEAEPRSLVGKKAAELYSAVSRAAVTAAREKQNVDGLSYSLDVTLLKPNRGEVACRITGAMVQRSDLHRFRVVTVRENGPVIADSASAVAAPSAPAPPTVAAAPLRITAAGRVQLVGLNEVRESLGPRWPALKERAMATAETVLRRRLGPRDTFSQTDDNGFVVAFADTTEEEAAFRAAAIGNEIRQRLIGSGESPDASQVLAVAVAVAPEDQGRSSAEFASIVKDRVSQRLRAIQASARETLAVTLRDKPYGIEPVYSARDRGKPIGCYLRFTTEMRRALDVALGALPAEESAGIDPDVTMLGFAHECLIEHALQSPGSLVFVPLSSDILVARKRMEACIEACRAIDEQQRKQLVLVVTSPAEGALRKINAGLPRLRSFCKCLGVAVERYDPAELDVAGAGILFVVVDGSAPGSPSRFKASTESLRALRCHLLVHGADSADATRFFEGGAPFVSIANGGVG